MRQKHHTDVYKNKINTTNLNEMTQEAIRHKTKSPSFHFVFVTCRTVKLYIYSTNVF